MLIPCLTSSFHFVINPFPPCEPFRLIDPVAHFFLPPSRRHFFLQKKSRPPRNVTTPSHTISFLGVKCFPFPNRLILDLPVHEPMNNPDKAVEVFLR